MDSPHSPGQRSRWRILAVAGATVLALCASEVALRIAQPSYSLRSVEYFTSPVRGPLPSWILQPGSTATYAWDGDPLGVLPPGARASVPINAVGLRGPLPRPGEDTVIVLGDSFTFGEGVADGATFVDLVQQQLRGDFPNTALVNAGIPAQGTADEAGRLPQLVETFAPRAVVLVHIPNDAVPFGETPSGGEDLLNVAAPGGSRLLSLLTSRTASSDVEAWYLSYYTGARREHWERSREIVSEMQNYCRSRDIAFGIVAFPLMHRLGDSPLATIPRQLGELAHEVDTAFLDLAPAFADEDASELWVHPVDRHPNARAHAIAADAMAPFVRSLLRATDR